MAYDKTITDANVYYGTDSHIRAYDWANYSTEERTAALAHAQRQIELYLQRDAENPASTDRYRDDYAIFEQAIFLLDETPRTRQSTNSAQIIPTVRSEERDETYGVTISPEAMRYLALKRLMVTNG